MVTEPSDPILACRHYMRASDRERFWLTLFAPADKRPALWALFALQGELCAIRQKVSEPLLGQMRLQWWRDGLLELNQGRPRGHYVLQAIALCNAPPLREAIADGLFEAMIDAHESDLVAAPFADADQRMAYVCANSGLSFQLALRILGYDEAHLAQRAKSLGCAWDLTWFLRQAHRHHSSRWQTWPQSWLQAAALRPADLFRDDARSAVPRDSLIGRARDEISEKLHQSYASHGDVPPGAAAVMLAGPMIKWQMAHWRKHWRHDLERICEPLNYTCLIALLFRAWRGIY